MTEIYKGVPIHHEPKDRKGNIERLPYSVIKHVGGIMVHIQTCFESLEKVKLFIDDHIHESKKYV